MAFNQLILYCLFSRIWFNQIIIHNFEKDCKWNSWNSSQNTQFASGFNCDVIKWRQELFVFRHNDPKYLTVKCKVLPSVTKPIGSLVMTFSASSLEVWLVCFQKKKIIAATINLDLFTGFEDFFFFLRGLSTNLNSLFLNKNLLWKMKGILSGSILKNLPQIQTNTQLKIATVWNI